MNSTAASVGQKLLGLRYVDISHQQWMTRRQRVLYGLLTVGSAWLEDRLDDFVALTRHITAAANVRNYFVSSVIIIIITGKPRSILIITCRHFLQFWARRQLYVTMYYKSLLRGQRSFAAVWIHVWCGCPTGHFQVHGRPCTESMVIWYVAGSDLTRG